MEEEEWSSDEPVGEQDVAEAEGYDGGEDEPYFESYAQMKLQKEMVSDQPRNAAYRKAIEACVVDKVVLDVGCGTGLLSFFSALCGARRVYGVEASYMAWHAHQVVQENPKLQSQVFITQCKVEDVRLQEQVHVIVSEWMGSFLLFEGMLDSVICARDTYLTPGGTILPSSARIWFAPVSVSPFLWKPEIDFWANVVEGIDMSHMGRYGQKEKSARPIHDTSLPPDSLLVDAPQQVGKTLEMLTVQKEDLEHIQTQGDVVFKCKVGDVVEALAVWFDVSFPDGTILSTGPRDAATHWHQEILVLENALPAWEEGDELRVSLDIVRNAYWRRHYVLYARGRMIRGVQVIASFDQMFPHHRKPTKAKKK